MSEESVEVEVLPAIEEKRRGLKLGTKLETRIKISDNLTIQDKSKFSDELAAMLELYVKGCSTDLIAKALNLPQRTIVYRLGKYTALFKYLENIEEYQAIKGRLFDAAEFELLSFLVRPDKLKKAPLSGIASAFQQVHNANRLAKGLSTAINSNTEIKFTGTIDLGEIKKAL